MTFFVGLDKHKQTGGHVIRITIGHGYLKRIYSAVQTNVKNMGHRSFIPNFLGEEPRLNHCVCCAMKCRSIQISVRCI